MQRRNALKGLAVSLCSLVNLPAWASGWTPDSLGLVSLVSIDEEALVGEMVETLIPETGTPGAKTLRVHQFVLRMVQDCYSDSAQTGFRQGLELTEHTAQQLYAKTFVDCDALQRMDCLSKTAGSTDPVGKSFVDMLKRTTIQGYTNSEYYLVNVQKFNMAPGFYHGCVPVPN